MKYLIYAGIAYLAYKLLGSSSSGSGDYTATFEVNTPGLDKDGYPISPGQGASAPADNTIA